MKNTKQKQNPIFIQLGHTIKAILKNASCGESDIKSITGIGKFIQYKNKVYEKIIIQLVDNNISEYYALKSECDKLLYKNSNKSINEVQKAEKNNDVIVGFKHEF